MSALDVGQLLGVAAGGPHREHDLRRGHDGAGRAGRRLRRRPERMRFTAPTSG